MPRCLQTPRKQTVVVDKHAGLGVRLGVLLLADLDRTRVLQGRLCALPRIRGGQGICSGAVSEAARVFSWI